MHGLHFWDVVLIAVVIVQATTIAYIYRPRLKAFVSALPLVFCFAVLSIGKPIDACNVAGLGLVWLFAHAVRWLHYGLRLSIIPAIAISFLGFCLVGTLLSPHIPRTDGAFYASVGVIYAFALVAYLKTPHRIETGHRTPLPLYIKLSAIILVVLGLVSIKALLGGFLTTAPMVSTITVYESRRSLWTTCRYAPILVLSIVPIMIVSRLSQPRVGLGWSLVAGSLVALLAIVPLTLSFLRAQREATRHGESPVHSSRVNVG